MRSLLALLFTILSVSAQTAVCFHGNGDGGQWTNPRKEGGRFVNDLRAQGFTVIVAQSKGRKWSPVNSSSNPDIKAVLKQLQGTNPPYYLIGHSNGGGFLSRFVAYSGLTITAVQYSNSSGALAILENEGYTVPSLFCYNPSDKVVPYDDVREAIEVLHDRGVHVDSFNVGPDGKRSQHAFVNTASVTGPWFKDMTQ